MTLPLTALSASTAMPTPRESTCALVEIGDRDAHRRVIDDVVGNHRALEGKLRIERDLTESRAGIADHLTVRAGIGTDPREGAIGDAVVAHHHRACTKHIDPIAVLATAAALCGDTLDPVGGNDGAVFADCGAPDEDAVVAAVAHMVVADFEPRCVLAEEAAAADVADLAVGNTARDFAEHDPVRSAAGDEALR